MRFLLKILLALHLVGLYPFAARAAGPAIVVGLSVVPIISFFARIFKKNKSFIRRATDQASEATLQILKTDGDDFQAPYWAATKNGKTLWLMGLAVGTPLKNQDCSAHIEEQLLRSDFALLAQKPLALSWEEKQTISLGSPEEKQALLAKLPDEERAQIEEPSQMLSQLFSRYFSTQSDMNCSSFSSCLRPSAQSFADELFSALSPETQDFLTSFQPEGSDSHNVWDYIAKAILKINDEFYFSMAAPDLLHEIGEIALSRELPTEFLSDDIVESFPSLAQIKEERQPLTPEDVEQLVGHFKAYREQIRSGQAALHNPEDLYASLSAEEVLILDERLKPQNEYLLERFKTALSDTEGNSVFGVASHVNFIGSSSIQNMLEEEGFSLQQVECLDLPAGEGGSLRL